MTKPKIIFFDIDGTLVPLKEGIRPRTVEALQKLRQNGIKLCIATGRAPMEVPKFEGVTFDAFLTYNGSYCFTPERDVFKNLIPKADIALLRRNAEALGRPMALATKDRLAANGSDPDLAEYFAIGGVELVIADSYFEGCTPCKDRGVVESGCGHHSGQRRQGDCRGKGVGVLWHRQVRQHGLR